MYNTRVNLCKYVQYDLSLPKNHCRCVNENRMSKKSFSSDKTLQKDWVIAISEFIFLKYFNISGQLF